MMKRWLGRLLFVVLGCVCSVIAVELFLRIFMPAPVNTNRSLVKQNLPGLAKVVEVEPDELGLRSATLHDFAKGPGVFRILCMGGSTTCQHMHNLEDTWSRRLEILLGQTFGSGMRFEVAAYGRNGAPVAERYKWAVKNFDRVKPDMVIHLEGINDLCWRGGPEYKYSGNVDDLLTQFEEPDQPMIEHGPYDFLQLVQYYKRYKRLLELKKLLADGKAVEWHTNNIERLREDLRKQPALQNPHRDPDPFMEFSDVVERILQSNSEHGIATVLVGQPVLWNDHMPPENREKLWFAVLTDEGRSHVDPAWMWREMKRYNDRQGELAAKYGAAYVDLEPLMPKTPEYFVDDCHFTIKGSHKVAELILPTVVEEIKRVTDLSSPPKSAKL